MNVEVSSQGPTLSRIVAGCMNWGEWGVDLTVSEVQKLIDHCFDIGVTTFDHADIYGHYTTEKLFGDAIKGNHALRQKIQIISKCGIKLVTPNRPDNNITSYDTSKEYIIDSVEQSLKKLQTDYLDLLLIHRPSPLMNPYEVAEAFTKLKKEGKALYFGVSNFTRTQFELLDAFVPLVTNQVEISPLHLDPFLDGTLDQCITKKIKPMGYSTLAKGSFFSNHPEDRVVRINEVTSQLAIKYNTTVDKVLISWIIKHPSGIIPVIGSTKIGRIQSAVDALEIQITDEEWFMVWEASMGKPVP